MAIRLDVDIREASKNVKSLTDQMEQVADKSDKLSEALTKGFKGLGKDLKGVKDGLGSLAAPLKSMITEMQAYRKALEESRTSTSDWTKLQKTLDGALKNVVKAIESQTKALKDTIAQQEKAVRATVKQEEANKRLSGSLVKNRSAYKSFIKDIDAFQKVFDNKKLSPIQQHQQQMAILERLRKGYRDAYGQIRLSESQYQAMLSASVTMLQRVSQNERERMQAAQKARTLAAAAAGEEDVQRRMASNLKQLQKAYAEYSKIIKSLSPLQQFQRELKILEEMKKGYGERGSLARISEKQYQALLAQTVSRLKAVAQAERERATAAAAATRGIARGPLGAGAGGVAARPRTRSSADSIDAMGASAARAQKNVMGLFGGMNLLNQVTAASRAAMIGAGQSFGIFTGQTIAAAAAAYGLARAIRSSITVGTEFEYAMTKVRVLMSDTSAIMDGLSSGTQAAVAANRNALAVQGEIIELAEKTQFNLVEVAEGAEILARSGENAAFIYSNLGSVLDLAAIGMVDMGTAAGIATGVMASFADTGMQFSDAVDILAAASVRTKATVEDIGLSLQYIGPLAAQAGISFKDLTAAIGTLADVNIKGAKAGTAMRRIITNLLAPTASAREAFTDLKLNIEDFTKNGVVNLQEVFEALNRQGAGIQHIKAIWGQYAVSAAAALVQSTEALRRYGEEFGNVTGLARRMRDELRNNLKMDLENLTSVWMSLQATAFGAFGPDLRKQIQELTSYLEDNMLRIAGAISDVVNSLMGLAQGIVENHRLLIGLVQAFVSLKVAYAIVGGLWARWSKVADAMKTYRSTAVATTVATAGLGASVAATTASVSKMGTVLAGARALIGGWPGIIATAVAALGFLWMRSGEAAEVAVQFSHATDSIEAFGNQLSSLSTEKVTQLTQNLNKDISASEALIERLRQKVENLKSRLDNLPKPRALNIWDSRDGMGIVAERMEARYAERMREQLLPELAKAMEDLQLAEAELARQTKARKAIQEEAAQRSIRELSNMIRYYDLNKKHSMEMGQAGVSAFQGVIDKVSELTGMDLDGWISRARTSFSNFLGAMGIEVDLKGAMQRALDRLRVDDMVNRIQNELKRVFDFEGASVEDLRIYKRTLDEIIDTLTTMPEVASRVAAATGRPVGKLIEWFSDLRQMVIDQLPKEKPIADPKAERALQKAADELRKYFSEYERGQGSAQALARELKAIDDWIAKIQSGTPAATRALAEAGFTAEEAMKAMEFNREKNIFEFVETTLAAIDPRFKDFIKTMNQVTATTLATEDAMNLLAAAAQQAGIAISPEIWEQIRAGIQGVNDGSADLRAQWDELVRQAAKIKADLGGPVSFEEQVQQFSGLPGNDEEDVRLKLALTQAYALFGDSLRTVREETSLLADAEAMLNVLVKHTNFTREEAIRLMREYSASLPIGSIEHEIDVLENRIKLLGRSTREQAVFNASVAKHGANWRTASVHLKTAAGELDKLQGVMATIEEVMKGFWEKNPFFALADAMDWTGQAIESASVKLAKLQDQLAHTPESESGIRAQLKSEIEETEKELEGLHRIMGALQDRMVYETAGAFKAMAEAAKAFKDEGSKGFKDMEKAIAALSIVQDLIALKAAVAAVLTQGQGEPYSAWTRMMAMAAAVAPFLASIGVTMARFGGGSGPSASERRQASQGTGTVLGDAEAKSESILRATEITADATTALVGINRGMLRALMALQDGIAGASGQLARGAGNVEFGAFNPGIMLNRNTGAAISAAIGTAILPVIGTIVFGVVGAILGSFLGGSSRLSDQGILVRGGGLDDIGFGAYQEHQVRRWRWGSRRTVTMEGDLSDDVTRQFDLVMQSIVDTVREAALALGLLPAEIEAALATYRQEEIRISLMDLSAEEQEAELRAVFSQIFDGLAGHVVPFIDQFQQVGEGLGETLVRVATSVQVVQEAMRYLGLAINETDPERMAQISVGLVEMAGGVEQFASQMLSFADKFAPEDFRFEADASALNEAFDQMGLTLPATREEMWELMRSLDVTTESGREAVATLLRLADTADAYYTALERRAQEEERRIRELENLMLGIDDALGEFNGTQYIRQFMAIDRTLNDNLRTARALGASEAQLNRIRQLAAYQTAQLVAQMRESIASLWEQFQGVPADVSGGLSSASSWSNELYEAERRRYEMAQDAIERIGEYLMSLTYNDLAPTDWRTRLGANRATFDEMMARAMAGDEEAISNITQYADDLLQMGREMLGPSTAYASLYDYVTTALRNLQAHLGTIEEPPGGASYGEGTMNSPIVSVTPETDKYALALQIAGQIGALNHATGADVFRLLEEFGIPLLDLVGAMNINLGHLTMEGLQNLSLLANALNMDLVTLIDHLGIDYDRIAEVFGFSIEGVTNGVLDGFREFAEWLGVPVLEALELLGIDVRGVAAAFGYEIGVLSADNWATMKELARLLGLDVLALGEAIGEDLGLVKEGIVGDLGAVFAELPDDLPDGIREQLTGLFEDLGEATSPEEVRRLMNDLYVLTRDNLPGSFGTALGEVFASLGLVPPTNPQESPWETAMRQGIEGTKSAAEDVRDSILGRSGNVFDAILAQLIEMTDAMSDLKSAPAAKLNTEALYDFQESDDESSRIVAEQLEAVKKSIAANAEAVKELTEVVAEVSERQVQLQQAGNEELSKIRTNTRLNTLKERRSKKL